MSTEPSRPTLALQEQDLLLRCADSVRGHQVTAPQVEARLSPRPYWHPLRTPQGTLISDYRPDDHAWHWGLSLAISNIEVTVLAEQTNLWGGVTWVTGEGYRQLPNNGTQRHDAWTEVGPDHATEQLTWETASGAEFLAEARTTRTTEVATPTGQGWRMDVTSQWRNLTAGEIRFGSPTTAGRENAGYGGFFLRGAPELVGATVHLDGQPVVAAETQGRTGRWLSFTSPAGAAMPVTVAMASAGDNPVGETTWFLRNEPVVMMCAAPFFHTEWPLAAGTEATWRWSLLILDGRIDPGAVGELLT